MMWLRYIKYNSAKILQIQYHSTIAVIRICSRDYVLSTYKICIEVTFSGQNKTDDEATERSITYDVCS